MCHRSLGNTPPTFGTPHWKGYLPVGQPCAANDLTPFSHRLGKKGIAHFAGNPHDSKTLDQVAHWIGQRYKRVLVDQGYLGHGHVGDSAVMILDRKIHASTHALRRHRQCCKHHSAIATLIGHLKSNHSMGRNYLKGSIGDSNNALLVGMRFNLMLLLSA